MDIIIIVAVVVAIVAVGFFLVAPRMRGRSLPSRRGGEEEPAGRRAPGERRHRVGERRLIAEGEAIRDRVEEDLRRTPPSVRAQRLASQGTPELPVDAYDRGVGYPPAGEPGLAGDPELYDRRGGYPPDAPVGDERLRGDPEVDRAELEELRARELAARSRASRGTGDPVVAPPDALDGPPAVSGRRRRWRVPGRRDDEGYDDRAGDDRFER
jgi:hypothetical protein